MAGGNDQFTWDTAGTMGGAINLGAGNDTGTLQNLTEGILSSPPSINGGAGTDSLTLNTTATNPGRYVNWENVSLTNSSALTLNSNFVLGNSGTGTGSLSIDGSSTLYAGNGANGAIAPFTAGQLVNVTNVGTIDLTNDSTGALDTFTVLGNYTGSGGAIRLQTVLGDDSSASDKFIISGGTATGTTGLAITNLGAAGATAPCRTVSLWFRRDGPPGFPAAREIRNIVRSVPALCQSQCLARFQRHRCCPLRSRYDYQPK